MEITREYFLTVAGSAAAVGILVEIIKRWLALQGEQEWHNAAITTIAAVLGFAVAIGGYYANYLTLDGPTIVYLFFLGLFIGMMATGGYEWVKNLIAFVGGARGQA